MEHLELVLRDGEVPAYTERARAVENAVQSLVRMAPTRRQRMLNGTQ